MEKVFLVCYAQYQYIVANYILYSIIYSSSFRCVLPAHVGLLLFFFFLVLYHWSQISDAVPSKIYIFLN